MVVSFSDGDRRAIKNVVAYAKTNIFQSDDLLDMKNGEMITPGEDPGHVARVGLARWVCYFLVDHPNKGRCHYFQMKEDMLGALPDRPEMEDIVKEFGIDRPLLDDHINI